MEMEEIAEEQGRASAAQKVKTEGEEETNVYSKLQTPSEDIYSEAKTSRTKAGWALGLQDVQLWRRVSLCLGGICLVLIVAIVLLALKLQEGTSVAYCQGTPQNSAFPDSPSAVFRKRCPLNQCANGWLRHGESCFFLSTLRKTWDDAQKNCSGQGGSLAVVTTSSVQNFLTQSGRLPYWIGLRRNPSWTWINREPLTQSFWSDSAAKGNCVMLQGNFPSEKSWVISSCARPTYYICELPASKVGF